MVMLVKDAMVKEVITVERDAKIREACEILADNSIGCLVVTKNGIMCGILTERDIIKAVASSNENIAERDVSSVMTSYVLTIKLTTDVQKAINIMMKNKIKRLPVMSAGKVVGIITVSDIIAKWNY
jgi:CBS domain-containing protein